MDGTFAEAGQPEKIGCPPAGAEAYDRRVVRLVAAGGTPGRGEQRMTVFGLALPSSLSLRVPA